jgi:oligopeptide transport system substrate-binding protein
MHCICLHKFRFRKHLDGVDIQLLSCENKVFYDRLKTHDYQLGIGSWFADIDDPISFLEVFKFKNNGTNNTRGKINVISN